MKRLILFLLFAPLLAPAADQIVRLNVAVTNLPVTGNNLDFTAPLSKTITWSNVTTTSYVSTNATKNGAATNLFLQIASFGIGVPSLSLEWRDTNSFDLIGAVNQNIAATNGGSWAQLTLSTQPVSRVVDVRTPIASEKYSSNRVRISSELVRDISLYSTNSWGSNDTAMLHFISIGTNAQTVLGKKTLNQLHGGTNTATIYGGTNQALRIVDAHSISGTNGNTVGGYNTNGVFDGSKFTNAVNYGNAFSSPGASGTGSEQFGSTAIATNDYTTAVGFAALANGNAATALGNNSQATNGNATALGAASWAYGDSSTALGLETQAYAPNSTALGAGAVVAVTHTNSTAIGYTALTTANNQIMLGNSTVAHVYAPGRIEAGSITNAIFTGTNSNTGDWSDTEVTESTLANGDNTPAFTAGRNVRWAAGPTAAFAISGFTGIPRSGQIIDRWNDTGQAVTLNNESGTTGATNRILTLHGTNVVCGTNAHMTFQYSAARSRWKVININPAP